jgi:hypothetical protein
MVGTGCATNDGQSGDVPGFNEMDRNNDGGLTREEASRNPRLSAHFDQVDDNRDGKLTRGEYLEAMGRRDWYALRENVAGFIEPDDKPPLSIAQQEQGAQQPSAQSQAPGETAPGRCPCRAARNWCAASSKAWRRKAST